MKSLTTIVAFALMITSLLGCGRSNVVYSDGQQVTTDGLSLFPPGIYNQSVNQAYVNLKKVDASNVVRFKTRVQANAAGAYNDTSQTGNFALLGIALFDSTPLSLLGDYAFEAKQITGSRPLNLYLQVDLNCDHSIPYVLQATSHDLIQTSVSNGYVSYSALSSDFVWTSHGSPIISGSTTLIPETDSGTGVGSIQDLIAVYPNACISNAETYDPGFPVGLPTAGVLIGLGDSSEVLENEVNVRSIDVGSHNFSNWGH
jgi:hypothetical protein